MKIKTRLMISTCFALFIGLIAAILIFTTFEYAQEEEERMLKSNEIQTVLFVLNLTTYEYLSKPGEDTKRQWEFIYDYLLGILEENTLEDNEDRVIFGRIQDNFKKINSIFLKFGEMKEIDKAYEHAIMVDFIQYSRTMVYDASLLNEASHERIQRYFKSSGVLIIGAILMIVLLVPILLYIFNKSVVRPLIRLNKGIEIIGTGHLDYRVGGGGGDDELGHITDTFNKMTEKLKVTTVSRDDLIEEVERRKNAEKEYLRVNEELEVFAEERARRLIESDKNFTRLMDSAPIGLMITSLEGSISDVNKAFLDMMGFQNKKDVLALNADKFYYDKKYRDNFVKEIELNKFVKEMELPMLRKDKTLIWVATTAKTYVAGDGKEQVFNAIQDISGRKWTREALRNSEAKYRNLVETSHDLIWQLDKEGRFIFLNQAWEKTHGYTVDEMHGMHFSDIQKPLEQGEIEKLHNALLNRKQVTSFETVHLSKSGKEISLVLKAMPLLNSDSEIVGYQGTGYDITERKKMEEQIKKSLHEKEVLLREVHHRVKNNMQIISSLIRLQTGYLKDVDVIGILNDVHNRVKSMALVHEKLYQSEDLDLINFETYMKDLTSYLFSAYKVNEGRVYLHIDISAIYLKVETAIPMGLISSELISNSLKHAFPEQRSGEINISLNTEIDKISNKTSYELKVGDNGIGIGPDVDLRNTESLGLQLVFSMAEEQMEGKVFLDRTDGLKYTIRFKELDYQKRI